MSPVEGGGSGTGRPGFRGAFPGVLVGVVCNTWGVALASASPPRTGLPNPSKGSRPVGRRTFTRLARAEIPQE